MSETTPTPEAPAQVAPADADIIAQLDGAPQNGTANPPAPTPEKAAEPEPSTPRESAFQRSLQKRERDLVASRQKDREERTAWEASFEQRVRQRVEEELGKVLADQRAIEQKQKTPEEQAAEREAKLREEIRAELRQELGQRDATASRAAAVQAYKSTADEMVAKGELENLFLEYEWPEVLEQTDRLVLQLRDECKQRGEQLPKGNIDAKLLRLLDKRAKAKQDSRTERQKARQAPKQDDGKAAPQGDTKAGANGSGHQGAKAGASATTTLGKGLGERVAMPSPGTDILSDEEVLERALESVSKGTAPKPKYTP